MGNPTTIIPDPTDTQSDPNDPNRPHPQPIADGDGSPIAVDPKLRTIEHAPSVGDLGAAPSADVDHLTAATQKIRDAEEKLKQQSAELKRKIDEAKKANSMPIDSQLGSPDFERRAADGSLDVKDEDDE